MTGLKHFILSLVAIGAGMSLAQPSQAQQIQRTPALEKLIKDAQAEKELNLSWGPSLGAATGAKLLQDAMNKEFGTSIKVTYTPGPAMPQLASRIIQEIEAGKKPTSDLVLGAETTFTQLLRCLLYTSPSPRDS